jgi:hypothetical protein
MSPEHAKLVEKHAHVRNVLAWLKRASIEELEEEEKRLRLEIIAEQKAGRLGPISTPTQLKGLVP